METEPKFKTFTIVFCSCCGEKSLYILHMNKDGYISTLGVCKKCDEEVDTGIPHERLPVVHLPAYNLGEWEFHNN